MLYRVTYRSMTAFYGPAYIEADSEYEARRKFAVPAFSQREMPLIKAAPVSESEIKQALQAQEEE